MVSQKNMKVELEKYKDRVYFLNKSGQLTRVRIDTLDDYNHYRIELHHFIPYQLYERNIKWFKERHIEQKLILVSKTLHEHIENRGIKTLTDEEFKKRYKISRWKLIFNRKYSDY